MSRHIHDCTGPEMTCSCGFTTDKRRKAADVIAELVSCADDTYDSDTMAEELAKELYTLAFQAGQRSISEPLAASSSPAPDTAPPFSDVRWHLGYEVGYREGESSHRADVQAAEEESPSASSPAWEPIETAPKEPDQHGLSPLIILGFAPDEENYTLRSCEGYWRARDAIHTEGWVSTMDYTVLEAYLQPTHWLPLPPPPKEPT